MHRITIGLIAAFVLSFCAPVFSQPAAAGWPDATTRPEDVLKGGADFNAPIGQAQVLLQVIKENYGKTFCAPPSTKTKDVIETIKKQLPPGAGLFESPKIEQQWIINTLSKNYPCSAHVALAQKPLEMPTIRTCVKIVVCEDGTDSLSPEEKKKLKELMSVVKAGTTAAQISAVYKQNTGIKAYPVQVPGKPPNTMLYMAEWFVTDQTDPNHINPRIDVYFMNDTVCSFKWWQDGVLRHVNVTLPVCQT